MPSFQDLTGQTFHRLLVIERAPNNGNRVRWRCRCECGREVVVRPANLKNGNTQSCGCLKLERVIEAATGRIPATATHLQSKTLTYKSWTQMKQRCFNPNATSYELYGGRGITVCERWRDSFENFLADMGERAAGTSLDRIDSDGNYEPSNCRWADSKKQSHNRRNVVHITYAGVTRLLHDWDSVLGLPYGCLAQRLKQGWSVAEAIETPLDLVKSESGKRRWHQQRKDA